MDEYKKYEALTVKPSAPNSESPGLIISKANFPMCGFFAIIVPS